MPLCNDLVKRRVIRFKQGDSDIAERAARLLEAVDGVANARILSPYSLSIHYDIRTLSLQMIESALADVGFELSNNLLCRIKRELIAYCEDNQREIILLDEAEQDREHDQVEQTAHDPRPWHWRNYT